MAHLTSAQQEEIERAIDESFSKQPRFQDDGGTRWLSGVLDFLKTMSVEQPSYQSHSRKRDAFLREWYVKEPWWAAVIKNCAMLDANRPWTLTGGRNQVLKYSEILHHANDGDGWRNFMMQEATAFRTADMCSVVELGRDVDGGALRGLYFVDPANCVLTGKRDYPLQYFPPGGGRQDWTDADYFRAVSMPWTDERFHGLGFCATSMAFELLLLLYSVLNYDNEQLGARMPQGLLLLQGISQDQWYGALQARKSELDAEGRARYGGVMILATAGDSPPDAKVVGLSSLPAGFDRQTFIEQTVYAYSAIVGRDASEFIPVQTGSIGRGLEPEVQHRKAVAKGGNEYLLAFQERLQRELPQTLLFEFDESGEEAQMMEAQIAETWTRVVSAIRYPVPGGEEQISQEQFLAFLVDKGIIPTEWTLFEESTQLEDTEGAGNLEAIRSHYRATMLQRPDVQRAVSTFPTEPIVRMRWSPVKGLRETVLWDRGIDALSRRVWRSAKPRQDDSPVLFQDGDVVITEADVDRAIAEAARRVPPGDDEEKEPGLAPLLSAREEPSERTLATRLKGMGAKLRGER